MARSRSRKSRGGRAGARRLVVQALYQWQLTGYEMTDIVRQFRASDESRGADLDYFERLTGLVAGQHADLDGLIARFADRAVEQLDPVEHGILLMGLAELGNCPEVPYRVVINEALELAKAFGAADGHRYVNAVLDRASRELRQHERGVG